MASEANGADTEADMQQQPTPSPPPVVSVKEEEEQQETDAKQEAQELPPSSSTDAISPKQEDEEMLEQKQEPEEAPSSRSTDGVRSTDAVAVNEEEEQHTLEMKREPEEEALARRNEVGAVNGEETCAVKEEEELQTPELNQEAEPAPLTRSSAASPSEEKEEEVQPTEQEPEPGVASEEEEQQQTEAPIVPQQEQRTNEEAKEDSGYKLTELQQASEASRSSTSIITAAAVNHEAIAAELQCVLCHDVFVKPVTITCGHSFCRICLLDSLLSRSIDESECPICRAHLLDAFSPTEPIGFNVNVALWNIAQMLVLADRSEQLAEEDEEYTLKLDQLDAKWRIRCLQAQDVQAHNRRLIERNLGVRLESMHGSDLNDSTGSQSDENEGDEDRRRGLYPQLRVENIEDGRLKVKRNIVLDTDDENEDGHQGMRMCFAVVEFPSIVDTFSEHQECSIAMLKMEEDEDLDAGFPFFMDENGDDDNLVISDYYNDIKLQVFDDASNLVMERMRSARRGIIEFPGLRLDVPEGVYTFRFSDDTFGSFLSIKTRLGDLHEAPLQSDTYISLVDDEAVDEHRRDRGRGRRRRRLDSEEEHDEELSEESDDSFIVGDDEHDGAMEGHSEDEGVWEFHSDDEEQDEARERRQQARRRQQEREVATFSGDEDEGDGGNSDRNSNNDDDQDGDNEIADEEVDEDDGEDHVVSRQKRVTSSRFVLDSDEDEEHKVDSTEQERGRPGEDEDVEVLSDDSDSNVRRTSTTRTQRIITDEDDSLNDVQSPLSLNAESESIGSSKAKRERVTASFSDDEEEESEDDSSERQEPPPKRRRTNQVIVDEYSDDEGNDRIKDEVSSNVYNYAESPPESQDDADFDDGDHGTPDGNYGNEQEEFNDDYDDEDDREDDQYPDEEEEDYEDHEDEF